MPAAMAPRRTVREFQSAERTDDFRLHVVELRLDDEKTLIDSLLRIGIGLELAVAMESFGCFGEIAHFFEDDRFVEDRRRVVRTLLLRVLKEFQRRVVVAFRVEKLTAIERLDVVLVSLALFLELALEFQLELQLRNGAALGTVRKELHVAIDF